MRLATTLEPAAMFWRAWRYRIRHDPAEIAFLLKHLRSGDTAIDIGAHKGAYTWWMARAVGSDGRVLSFEPQPELAQKLANLTHHPMLRRVLRPVRVCPVAVSDRQGRATMHVTGDGPSPGASLRGSDGGAHRYPVPTATLDEWLAEHPGPPPALIKVDVEGHEAAVFAGAERTLRRHRPALLFECEHRHHDAGIAPVFEYLSGLGYRGWCAMGRQWLPIERFDGDRHQVPGQRPYVNNFLCM